jgi:hypothetical protein
MKNCILQLSGAVVLGMAFLTANVGFAQTETTTTRTTTSGTISEFSPQAITIRSETSPAPLHYTSTKTTTYVDESGNPVSVETVRSGLPVTVFYTRNGDQLVADKVVVKKTVTSDGLTTESQQTTTTTSNGTITESGPSTFSVRTESSASPLSYSFTKTTTYVDENGNPVSVETVKSGVPVTVYYTREGDQMVANKVIVRKTTTSTTTTPNP